MDKVIVLPAEKSEVLDQEWGRLIWKASENLGNSDSMTVGICEIAPGMENPRHLHPNCNEVLYVLQGVIVHTFGDEEVVMNVGDVITVTPHIPHNARNIGNDKAVLAISFDRHDRMTVGE